MTWDLWWKMSICFSVLSLSLSFVKSNFKFYSTNPYVHAYAHAHTRTYSHKHKNIYEVSLKSHKQFISIALVEGFFWMYLGSFVMAFLMASIFSKLASLMILQCLGKRKSHIEQVQVNRDIVPVRGCSNQPKTARCSWRWEQVQVRFLLQLSSLLAYRVKYIS